MDKARAGQTAVVTGAGCIGLVTMMALKVIEAVAAGKVNLKGIVTDVFGLDEVQKAMDYRVAAYGASYQRYGENG